MIAGQLTAYQNNLVVPEEQASQSLRIGFYIWNDYGYKAPIPAVHCLDLYSDIIQAEHNKTSKTDYKKFWESVPSPWICPNATDFLLQSGNYMIEMYVTDCSKALSTSYVSDDVECPDAKFMNPPLASFTMD